MSLKAASFLALIGTAILTALLLYDFVFDVLNVMQGLIPAVKIFSALVYTFASLTVAIFFFAFYQKQS